MPKQNKDDLKEKLYKEDPSCGICRQPLTIRETFTKSVNIDHKVPKYRGGTDRIGNLQLAHTTCNRAKGHD